VARRAGRIAPGFIPNLPRQRRKIAIVVTGYVGVEAAETETLKEVRLS
jgi:hypothetical protein